MAEKVLIAELRPRRLPHARRLSRRPAATSACGQGAGDGAGRHHRGGEEVEPPRARAARGSRPATKWSSSPRSTTGPGLPRRQRRRGRAGDVQGPLPARARPPRPHRGHAHRGAAPSARHVGFVYIRGEYVQPWRIASARPSKEAYDAGLLGRTSTARASTSIVVHRGAGAYICGEETGLLSSLEGKKGWPKIKPPFPAIKGAFGAADHREQRRDALLRAAHHRRAAPSGSPASAPRPRAARGCTRCRATWCSPASYEAPVAITLRAAHRARAAASERQRRLKAVVPGGSSAPILTADEIDVTMDVDGLKNAGHDGRLGRRDRDGRHACIPEALHGRGPLLRPRVVRPVHAVPRVHRLDLQDGRTGSSTGKGAQGGSRHHPRRRQARRRAPRSAPSTTARSARTSRYIEKFRAEFEQHVRHGACDVRRGRSAGESALRRHAEADDRRQGESRSPAGTNLIEAARRLGIEVRTTATTPGCRIAGAVPALHGRHREGAAPDDRLQHARRPTGWWCYTETRARARDAGGR